mmetsp:Transcript_17925/g.49643  ORF Transcript_17925/g.49643 Transcript_17925/m.49643 type:complete len:404 (-) Transcript_17925:1225-2436(-)
MLDRCTGWWWWYSWWEQDGVDHVDHTAAHGNVHLDNFRQFPRVCVCAPPSHQKDGFVVAATAAALGGGFHPVGHGPCFSALEIPGSNGGVAQGVVQEDVDDARRIGGIDSLEIQSGFVVGGKDSVRAAVEVVQELVSSGNHSNQCRQLTERRKIVPRTSEFHKCFAIRFFFFSCNPIDFFRRKDDLVDGVQNAVASETVRIGDGWQGIVRITVPGHEERVVVGGTTAAAAAPEGDAPVVGHDQGCAASHVPGNDPGPNDVVQEEIRNRIAIAIAAGFVGGRVRVEDYLVDRTVVGSKDGNVAIGTQHSHQTRVSDQIAKHGKVVVGTYGIVDGWALGGEILGHIPLNDQPGCGARHFVVAGVESIAGSVRHFHGFDHHQNDVAVAAAIVAAAAATTRVLSSRR